MEAMNLNNFFHGEYRAKAVINIMYDKNDNDEDEYSVEKDDDMEEIEPPLREIPPIYQVDGGDSVIHDDVMHEHRNVKL